MEPVEHIRTIKTTPRNLKHLFSFGPRKLEIELPGLHLPSDWYNIVATWCEALSFGGRLRRFGGSTGNMGAEVFLEYIIGFFTS